MKLISSFFLLLLLVCLGCTNQEVTDDQTSTTVHPIEKIFEDQAILAQLFVIEIEGRELTVSMVIKNKTPNRISFNSRDFIFKSNDLLGSLPTGRLSGKSFETKAPVWKEMEEIEAGNRAQERMITTMKKLSKYGDNIYSEVTLEGGKEITKKLVIVFDKKIDENRLEFFFNGKYKRLLKISKFENYKLQIPYTSVLLRR